MKDCLVCQLVFGPEERDGVRVLKQFKGYTVDFRLQQFRKVPLHALSEFIDFASPEGQTLSAQMHEKAEGVREKMYASETQVALIVFLVSLQGSL